MQHLHTKLIKKYQVYERWHQTKHHNKIHWGVLVVFTLFIFGTISRWTPIVFAADTVPPTAPTNLTATAISSSQINLSWTASTDNVGLTGYKIYRCAGSACAPTTQIATSATNSYSDTGLTASTVYTYVVSAYDAAGNESGKSAAVSMTTQAQTGVNITGVSGTLTNGSTITITGTGFGTKTAAAPFRWDNFESCATDSDIVAICGYNNEGGDGSKAYIKTDRAYGVNGVKSAKMDYVASRSSMFPRIGKNISPGVTEVYISHMAYFTRYSGTGSIGSFIFKWTRAGSNPPYSGVPKFYDTVRNDSSLTQNGSDRGYVTDAGTTWSQTVNSGQNGNQWNRVEYYYKLSTPGTANGTFQQRVNGVTNVNLTNALTRTSAENSSLIDYVMTPFDGLDSYIGGFYLWVDDYYIDTTQARIEICNASTKAASTQCEIQIPSAWSATSNTITVNQGSFSDFNNTYLYVVDSDGNVNESGYPVTIGGVPSDIQAPTTPTTLTATPISSSQINLSWTASTDPAVAGQAISGVTGYKIYRCAGSGCTPTVQIATSAVNSYSNTGLTASTAYTYAVSAYNAAGNESGKSSAVSATTQTAATVCSQSNILCVDDTAGSTQEYSTIQAAVNVAQAGDTVLVYAGIYTETTIFNFAGADHKTLVLVNKSGTVSAPLTIKAAESGVILDGVNPLVDTQKQNCFWGRDRTYVVIDGFECKNVNVGASSVSTGAIYFWNSNHITIQNNNIHDITATDVENRPAITVYMSDSIIKNNTITVNSVGIAGGMSGFSFTNNIIEGNTINPNGIGNGMYFSQNANDFIIRNNYIYNYKLVGIQVRDSVRAKIYNNVVYNSGTPVTGSGPWAVNLRDWSTSGPGSYDKNEQHEVYNNIIDDCDAGYAFALTRISNTKFYNNIITNCPKVYLDTEWYSVGHGEPSQNLAFDYNIYYNYTTLYERFNDTGYGAVIYTDGGHNLNNVNPLFVATGVRPFPYYTLQAGSPAINAGDTTTPAGKDFVGTITPQGSAIDIGAFEYVSTNANCSQSNILCVDGIAGSTQEYSTIQAAVNAAAAGDTILVRAGTYTDSSVINTNIGAAWLPADATKTANIVIKTAGTAALPITIKSAGGAVIVDGQSNVAFNLYGVSRPYYIIDGITFRNATETSVFSKGSNGHNFTVKNSIFEGNSSGPADRGLNLQGADNIVINNTFTYTNSTFGAIDQNYGTNIIISQNIITGSHYGIYLHRGSDNSIIEKNVLTGNSSCTDCTAILYRESNGVIIRYNLIKGNWSNNNITYQNTLLSNYPAYGNNNKILNNTIHCGNRTTGINQDPDGRIFVETTNNIISNCSTGIDGIDPNLLPAGQPGYNIIHGATYKYYWSGNPNKDSWPVGTANIVTDPLFVTPGIDYKLQAGSPAVDAGDPNTPLGTDFSGTIIPQGLRADIGAFEYISTDTTPPTTPTNLTATSVSSSQINLSWTASTDDVGVTGYNIYRCAGSACAPTVQIATSATNSYSDTGLTASTAYTYAVSAYDAAGNESGKSSSMSATTLSQFKQADFNKDGIVNQLDFDILKQDWSRTDKPVSDLNQDGIVDSRDLGIMMSSWEN